MDINKVLDRFNKLKSDRKIYESEWQEYVDMYMPGTQTFNSYTKPWQPITQIATQGKTSLQTLSATVFYGMISSGTKWFQFTSNEELSYIQLEELEKLTKKVLRIFTNVGNNFDMSFMKFVTSAIALGTGCIYINNDFGNEISFSHIPLSQYYIQKNIKGKVDVLVREFRLTPRKAIDIFGIKKVHKSVVEKYEQNSTEATPYIHCVEKDVMTGEFNSYYIDITNIYLIDHKPIKYFPYIVGTWAEHDGEDYGHGQAKIARSSMRYLSKLRMDTLVNSAFSADPVNLLTNDGTDFSRIAPGQNIYGGLDELTGQPKIAAYQRGGNSYDAMQSLQMEIDEISKAFYLDKITPPVDATRRTAYETSVIEQSQRQALTPHVSNLVVTLTELVETVIKILELNGELKEFESLKNVDIEVEFLSRLAKLLKMEDVRASQEFLQSSLPMLQFSPQLAGKFNFEKILETIREGTGAPIGTLKSDEEYTKILQAQVQQQQQQSEMQNALTASEISKNTGGLNGQ